jgi:uncharacterized membrane protein YraQ (UPF0718 family)
MTVTALIYVLAGGGLIFSWLGDRQKTLAVLKVAGRAGLKMLPSVLAVVILVGLVLGLVPPETIRVYLGEGTGYWGTFLAAIAGAITLLPSLVAFPLAASLLRSGASVMTIAAFVTTLTMVGFVTAPMEVRELGLRFTLVRNGLALVAGIAIALAMGVILG